MRYFRNYQQATDYVLFKFHLMIYLSASSAFMDGKRFIIEILILR